nr:MAG TPA: hypothetical protein [Caudoviricetes sp.]
MLFIGFFVIFHFSPLLVKVAGFFIALHQMRKR